jgi:hypothetical protein
LERRRKKRFPVRDGCLVTFGNNPIKPWQILDISEEGLAFRYIGGAEEPKGIAELDILTGDTVTSGPDLLHPIMRVEVFDRPAPFRDLPRRCWSRRGYA